MNAQYLSYIFPAIELIAALFATIHFSKYKHSREQYFLYFLWLTFIMDLAGVVLGPEYTTVKTIWYAVFTVVSFVFYFYWYYSILIRKQIRVIAIIAALLFLAVTALTYAFPAQLGGQGYAFVTGATGILVLTVCHFYQLLRSDEVLAIKYKLSFWISTALLLFYMGVMPLALLTRYIEMEAFNNTIILLSLNVILYGCYTIGFIWTKKEYNRL